MPDERELIHNVLRGDLNAFGLLVTRYEKLVFSVLSRMTDNQEDVKDISQDVFIKVYKNLGSFKFQSKLSTWIAKIAYLTAINDRKKWRGKHAGPMPEETAEIEFSGPDPASLVIQKDVSSYLTKLVEQLPLQYKTVLTLYHIHEFSYLEIGQVTGLPEGTVKGYLFRARRLLKEKVEQFLNKELI